MYICLYHIVYFCALLANQRPELEVWIADYPSTFARK